MQAEAEFVYQSVDHDGIRLAGGSSLPSGNLASTGSRSPSSATGFRRTSSGLAVWLYFRFTLSLRDIQELLAQRGIEAIQAQADRSLAPG